MKTVYPLQTKFAGGITKVAASKERVDTEFTPVLSVDQKHLLEIFLVDSIAMPKTKCVSL